MDIQPNPTGVPTSIDAARRAAARSAEQRSAEDGVPGPGDGGRRDSIDVSSEGGRLARIDAATTGAPDERGELVARLRARVRAGAYSVDHESLAKAMLEHDGG